MTPKIINTILINLAVTSVVGILDFYVLGSDWNHIIFMIVWITVFNTIVSYFIFQKLKK
jgi:hypothetical protein